MGTLIAVVRRRAINSRVYASLPYCASRMLDQLRRGHRAWPMFELKSGVAMAAPAAPMPPPLGSMCKSSLVPRLSITANGVEGLVKLLGRTDD